MFKRLELAISGKVQGIFFRQFIKEKADLLNLKGYVKNETNGTLIAVAEGEDDKLQELINHAKTGPRLALVTDVKISWSKPTSQFNQFTIEL